MRAGIGHSWSVYLFVVQAVQLDAFVIFLASLVKMLHHWTLYWPFPINKAFRSKPFVAFKCCWRKERDLNRFHCDVTVEQTRKSVRNIWKLIRGVWCVQCFLHETFSECGDILNTVKLDDYVLSWRMFCFAVFLPACMFLIVFKMCRCWWNSKVIYPPTCVTISTLCISLCPCAVLWK